MFITILLKISSIFIIVAMGIIASKLRLVPPDCLGTLNSFVLNVATPCMVLQSMQRDEIKSYMKEDILWSLAIFAIITVALLLISGFVLKYVKSIKEQDKGLYKLQVAFTNSGFMGYPLVTVIFGKYALFLAIIMNIVFTTLIYSIGIISLEHQRGDKVVIMKIIGQMLTLPFMSSIIGIVIFATGFHFPSFLNDSLSLVAATLSPVAMFIVGVNLSRAKIREIFTLRNLILCIISLVAVPAVTLGFDLLMPVSNIVMVTHVFLMAMPSAAVTTILAHRYNKNALLASEGVAATTFISLGTLSLWALFLTKFFL